MKNVTQMDIHKVVDEFITRSVAKRGTHAYAAGYLNSHLAGVLGAIADDSKYSAFAYRILYHLDKADR